MKAKYKAAIVGCGRIASLFAADQKRKGIVTHAQAYLNEPRTELVAACDLDRGRLEDFGKRWKVRSLYTDFSMMLRREKPDLLSVCTWGPTHAALVEQAVKDGVRGIICEKPISDTPKAAEKMIRLCRRKKVPLLVNHTRRFMGLYHRIRGMIARGAIGQVQGVSCYYTAGVLNTGTHLFDALRFLFGDVAWVWADPERVLGGEDKTYSGYLYFKNGFGCTLTALDVKHYLMFETDIYGTRQRVRLTNNGLKAQIWDAKPHPHFSGYRALKKNGDLEGRLEEAFPNLVRNLIRSIERKETPYCSGEDGKASLEVALALKRSAQLGGKKIRV